MTARMPVHIHMVRLDADLRLRFLEMGAFLADNPVAAGGQAAHQTLLRNVPDNVVIFRPRAPAGPAASPA